jgi:3-deoxy-manno-octulosonate cytidylyltransferase (CMP-KDO synthetase)
MTDPACENGTERCLEVLNTLKAAGETFDIVVNIQGDEPFIEAHHIDEVVRVYVGIKLEGCLLTRVETKLSPEFQTANAGEGGE